MKAILPGIAAACALMAVLPAGAQSLVHRYSFNGNAKDSVGTANGTVVGGVTFETDTNATSASGAVVNGNAVFPGGTSGSSPAYISLPASAVNTLQNATIEIFTTNVTMPSDVTGLNGPFQPLFTVASAYPDTTNYFILSPYRAGGGLGTAVRANSGTETDVLGTDSTGNFIQMYPIGVENHVVDVVFSGFTGVGSTGTETLYFDGKNVGTASTVDSFADLAATTDGIATVAIGGGSPFNDPDFNGSINEVRIFSGPLTAANVSADAAAGPSLLGFTPPLTITNVTATVASSTSEDITWTSSNPATTIVDYGPTSMLGTRVGSTIDQTSHSEVLAGLSPATTYYYEVTSIDAYGQTVTSPVATFTTGAGTSPTNLTAAGGNGKVTLSWSAPAGTGYTYVLSRSTSSGMEIPIVSGITSTTYTDTNVTGGTQYFYTVQGQNESGVTGSSNEASATPQTSPPTLTAITATPSTVTGTTSQLSVVGSDVSGESGLTYTWSATGPEPVSFSINGSNSAKSTVATFEEAGTYVLTVMAEDPLGLSATANTTVTVDQTLSGITVSPYGTKTVNPGMTQQYTAAGTDQFGYVQTITPTWSVSGGGTIDQTGLFTAGATASGSYTVTAIEGSVSGSRNVTVAPLPPTGLTATAGPANVTLTWQPLSGTNSYSIFRSTIIGRETLLTSGVTATTYLDQGLTPGLTYYYTISANSTGGPYSNEVSATPTAVTTGGPTTVAPHLIISNVVCTQLGYDASDVFETEVSVTISNTGTATAGDTEILFSLLGSSTPEEGSLPAYLGTLAPGASQTFTLGFSAQASQSLEWLRLNGISTGGAFGAAYLAAIPAVAD